MLLVVAIIIVCTLSQSLISKGFCVKQRVLDKQQISIEKSSEQEVTPRLIMVSNASNSRPTTINIFGKEIVMKKY